MLIIPAVDIKAGSCVRLLRGDPNKVTTYSSDPIQMAKLWVEQGAKRLHIIDLDGAFTGSPHHLEIAGKIKKECACEVQFGGGLREKEDVKKALDFGIDKLILGTAALGDVSWVKSALEWHAERFMVAIDAWEDRVTIEGWQQDYPFSIEDALKRVEELGFKEVIYTDINRDGTLEGPNFAGTKRVVSLTRMNVYASGGITSLEDVKQLKEIDGLCGMVIGKALYSNRLSLREAISLS